MGVLPDFVIENAWEQVGERRRSPSTITSTMPKEARTKPSRGMSQHAPLGRQIVQGEKAAEGKLRRVKADRDDGDGDDVGYIDSKTTRKIMQQAQQQREEMEAEAHAVSVVT